MGFRWPLRNQLRSLQDVLVEIGAPESRKELEIVLPLLFEYLSTKVHDEKVLRERQGIGDYLPPRVQHHGAARERR